MSPMDALVVTLYFAVSGTRTVRAPTSVVAVIAAVGAEKLTLIWPADTCRLALADDRCCPLIDPALLVASTGL